MHHLYTLKSNLRNEEQTECGCRGDKDESCGERVADIDEVAGERVEEHNNSAGQHHVIHTHPDVLRVAEPGDLDPSSFPGNVNTEQEQRAFERVERCAPFGAVARAASPHLWHQRDEWVLGVRLGSRCTDCMEEQCCVLDGAIARFV